MVLKGWFWTLWGAVGVTMHLGLVLYGLVPNLVLRPLHMAYILPWVFLAARGSVSQRTSGWLLTLIGMTACLWVAINADTLGDQYGALEGPLQLIAALALLLVVMEGARRAIGWPLPVIAALALAYGVWGPYIPGEFGHAGLPLASFLGTLTIAEGGLWGSLTGISVGVVAVFVIFGAILNAGEAGQGFMNLAAAAAGRLVGGAAKVSLVSSALFGSISGSASANVASTGAITLPAMTKLGYPKRLAAAVEAVASSGGQIMPPLMGAGAFVMVELTSTPYVTIMAAASLPAFLYFWTVWVGINAWNRREPLAPIPSDEQPSQRRLWVTSAFFAIPFAVLLLGMFAMEWTPEYAACFAAGVGALLLLINAQGQSSWGEIKGRIATALSNAGRQVAMIASIILCASIIVGVLSITGLGVKFTSVILSNGQGSMWGSLFLTALACLILGMEVPTTAAYIICVSVAGPALMKLGLEPLQVHLFVFWFALLSTITPPVCGAVFIAAGMVGEHWLKVAISAMALGVGLYVVPLGIISHPSLIAWWDHPFDALISMVQMTAGLAILSFALIAPQPLWRRALGLVVGLTVALY
jgi:TRAP transporter 4TM/12TM fusion protein